MTNLQPRGWGGGRGEGRGGRGGGGGRGREGLFQRDYTLVQYYVHTHTFFPFDKMKMVTLDTTEFFLHAFMLNLKYSWAPASSFVLTHPRVKDAQ